MNSNETLFKQIVKEACRDGRISQEEFSILKSLASLLDIGTDKGNSLASEIIDQYKKKQLTFSEKDSPQQLYRDLLLAFSDDHEIDEKETEALNKVKAWLNLTDVPTSVEPEFKEPEEPIVKANGDITPLRCSSCNGPVPLLRQPEVKCPFCDTSNIIPNAYLEALASRSSFEKRQKQAKDLFKLLGKPPTKFDLLISEIDERAFLVSILLSLGIVLTVVQSMIFYPVQWFYASYYGVNMVDVISPWTPKLLATFFTFFVIALPFFILYQIRRKVLTLKHVKIALAAKSPEKEGGPVSCRSCGCPFEVPPNTSGITCPYCQTDNLLDVPKEWLKETQSVSFRVGKSALMAQSIFKKETKLGWESILSVFLLFLVIGGINSWLISFRNDSMYLKEKSGWLPPYQKEAGNERIVRVYKGDGEDFKLGTWFKKTYTEIKFCIATKANEKVIITWKKRPDDKNKYSQEMLETSLFRLNNYGTDLPYLMKTQKIPPNTPTEFHPGVGGWYKFRLFNLGPSPYHLKIKLSKP
jgi:uncharacterized Zn finger protein (UPF0148 family)